MTRALELARRGLFTTHPNPRVGCVIVKDGEKVGEGYHIKSGGPHAEIHALGDAGELARGATAYVTLEPCSHFGKTPPCANALVDAGVSRVVAAMVDPNPQVAGSGLKILEAAGIDVSSGVLADEAVAINPGFIKRMLTGLPYVRVKSAMSLDGRTAMANGESQWITGADARADVQRLRAGSAAMVTGIGTVLADDPALNVRLAEPVVQPLRVVLDSQLKMPTDAKMLSLEGQTLILTLSTDQLKHDALNSERVQVETIAGDDGRLNLAAVLKTLASRDINEVMVEAGAVLSGAFVNADLVDELIVYVAPVLMGAGARGLFNLPGVEHMEQRKHLEITDMRAVGKDWRVTATFKQG